MSKPTLTLIRGLPGSGKSTLAKKLVADVLDSSNGSNKKILHLETDMYFIDEDGVYIFQAERLKEAHEWCQQQCEKALQQQQNVVVSNTFVMHWEMKIYQQLAKQYDAVVEVKVCTGKYTNIHGVPAATIKKMKQLWQV